MLNKIKREVDFEDGRLIGEDLSQLFAEAGGVDGREAEMVAAKSGTDLWPVLLLSLSNIFLRAWNKVWRDKNWICLPTGTCSGGSDNELPLAWAFLLDFFAAGALFEVVALRLRLFVCCCWWAVRTCTL